MPPDAKRVNPASGLSRIVTIHRLRMRALLHDTLDDGPVGVAWHLSVAALYSAVTGTAQ